MSRYALPVSLFVGHIAIVAALTAAVLVRLTDSSRDVRASIHYRAETVAASPSDRPPAPGALLGSPQGNSPSTTQDGTRLRPSEFGSESEPETRASPARAVPPPDDSAPDPAAPSSPAVHPPSDAQLAALQQLVAQSARERATPADRQPAHSPPTASGRRRVAAAERGGAEGGAARSDRGVAGRLAAGGGVACERQLRWRG
jgi:hypothetical protein